MRETPLHPFGIRLHDARIAELSDEAIAHLRTLLAEHGVLVLPDQDIDDHTFAAFLRRFGPLTFTAGEQPLDGHPDLNVISNVGRSAPPKSTFHVDTSYVRTPPAYTALRAVEIPEQGGQTVFSNQYRAYETLPAELERELRGRTIAHVITGVEVDDDAETAAEHPVFRPHPLTGRIALYLTAPARCRSISGLDDDRAAELIAELIEHSTRSDNLLRHSWAPGDVVIWDNAAVMHKADHSAVVGDRVMHRGMVGG